jgi:hypothetical protein
MDGSWLASLKSWTVERQHTFWLDLYLSQQDRLTAKELAYATVQRLEVLIVINYLPVVDSHILTQIFLGQLGVHGAKCFCLCFDLLALHLAQVSPHGGLDELFRLNGALNSNLLQLLYQPWL